MLSEVLSPLSSQGTPSTASGATATASDITLDAAPESAGQGTAAAAGTEPEAAEQVGTIMGSKTSEVRDAV